MRTIKHAVVLLLVLTAVPLVAQVPRVELFGGYSFSNGNPELLSERLNLHGWNASFTVDVNRWFGVMSDFSGHYGSTDILIPGVTCLALGCPPPPPPVLATFKTNNHTFLFGPQISLRHGKLSPFVHPLFGVERVNSRRVPFPLAFTLLPRTAFAMGFGGGIDYRIAPLLAWRTQADYLPTRQFSATQNNVRVSTGIVLRLGK